MSINDDEAARECYSKKAMPENIALEVARRNWRLRAYQCPHCRLWHVTNDKKAENRRQRQKKAWVRHVRGSA